MSMAVWVVFVAWLMGGFISGLVGVGGAMLAVPIAAQILSMHDVILISCILNVAMDLGLVVLHFRFCRLSAVWPMWLGALPGSWLGVYLLLYIPDQALRLFVGVSLLVFIYWQRLITVPRHGESSFLACLAGFVSGVLGSAISFDGPPVAAYALYVGWKPREVLGTLGVFFIVRGTMTVLLQWQTGLYSDLVLSCALPAIPATLLGTLVAFPLAKRMQMATFARILPAILTLAALSVILDALLA
ncbi:MAG: sulfite exporter TauE/SafE family protein [Desulfovibrio sp.]|nr:sulfite exporter TauE/SafE family protein [Desulfovibrio sp.]